MSFTKITNAGFGLTTGTLVGVAASFSSTVSVGGTLTYEDVTNVDSVGLITARNGIEITDKGVQVGTGATVDSAAANTLTFLTGGSERLRINSDGKVGINKTSPSAILHVASTNYQTIRLENTDNSANGPYVELYNNSASPADDDYTGIISFKNRNSAAEEITYTQIRSQSTDVTDGTEDGILTFHTYGAGSTGERLRINSDGKILVGHTDNISGGGLQVSGSSNDGNAGFHRFDANDSGPFIQLLKSRNGTVGSNTVVQSGDELGTLNFQGADGTDFHSGARIVSKVDGTPGNNDMPGRLEFHTTSDGASSPTERLRITSAGKIGINETAPAADLVVKQSGSTFTTASQTVALFQRSSTTGHSAKIAIVGGNAASSDINFGDTDDEDIGSIQYNHTDNSMRFETSATEALRINSSGKIGIGVINPTQPLDVNGWVKTSVGLLGTTGRVSTASGGINISTGATSNPIIFTGGNGSANLERMRIDTSGSLLLGTSSSLGDQLLQVSGSSDATAEIFVANSGASTGNTCALTLGPANNIAGSRLLCTAEEDFSTGANRTANLAFYTRKDGTLAERMRIVSEGAVIIAQTTDNSADSGHIFATSGTAFHTRDGNVSLSLNRLTSDGALAQFKGQNTVEGTISVSGSTVSYNGAHLSRWSQLPGGVERTEILRGSVLSNLDEMCEWGEEDNEQLNRMKVSDVEGDRNVAGVFQAWDDDDDTYVNDFYCAMTGDFVIRIAQGTTVARGDLLMSAGDGTAKPQDDDIVRSKTIAKVTSTTVSTTYSDNSYCVPCVLMAC